MVDTLIAATALERNLTVITVDHDFKRLPRIEYAFTGYQNENKVIFTFHILHFNIIISVSKGRV